MSRMAARRVRALSAAVLVLPLLGIEFACGHHGGDANAPSLAYGTENGQNVKAQLFRVPADQMSNLQVVTVETSALERVLRLTGSVAYNNFETTPVITQVGGPISRILVSPGDVVHIGQPLLDVASPDYAQDRTNYLKAQDAFALAGKSYERAKDLYAHHAIAEADLQQAESTRNQAQADLQAAEQALKVLGVSNLDSLAQSPSSAQIPLPAPIAGEVVERLVAPGQVIQAGATQCFTISNMKSVWVLANVYQQDLGYIHLDEPVEITTDAYPEVFRGRISYIAPALDPNSRTLQVRIVASNPDEKLKKDMYVTATVQAAVIRDTIVVPDAAVLFNSENQPFVYVEAAPNQFGQRLVTLGERQNGRTQILSGLKPGEQIAADGSLFLQFANSLQR
jgi:membrane fusion protein, heavy metal efflux system